jgi:membrane protease YdiL (CAAX protease family)
MSDNFRNLRLYEYSPLIQLIVSLVIIIGFGFLLMIILLIPGFFIFNTDISILTDPSSSASNGDLFFLRYMVIIQDLAIFIIPSLIILFLLKPADQKGIRVLSVPQSTDIILVIILALFILPVTEFTGMLNSGIHLPQWMSGVEQWMLRKEDQADGLIDKLIVSDSLGMMWFNILMIAVLPAIGEELVFRGVIQKILSRVFRSGHIAVWITAIVFSAIHLQFLGFIPRLILGLLFGYLFLWGGTLWLPIIAHFINNAIPVIGTHVHAFDKIVTSPGLPLWRHALNLLIPLVVCITILLHFRNKFKRRISDVTDQSATQF